MQDEANKVAVETFLKGVPFNKLKEDVERDAGVKTGNHVDFKDLPKTSESDNKTKLDANQLLKTITVVFKVLEGMSKITGTEVDDKVVAWLKPIVTEPWFADFVVEMFNFFGGRTPTKEEFEQVKASFKAKFKKE